MTAVKSSEGTKTSTKTNQNLTLACLILSCWLLTMLIVTREEEKKKNLKKMNNLKKSGYISRFFCIILEQNT